MESFQLLAAGRETMPFRRRYSTICHEAVTRVELRMLQYTVLISFSVRTPYASACAFIFSRGRSVLADLLDEALKIIC